MKKSVRKLLATLLALCLLCTVLPMGGLMVSADITADLNLVSNGDFEFINTKTTLVSAHHWNSYVKTEAKAEAAYQGNYGMHVKGNANSWAGLLSTEVAVNPGYTYRLTFWYKPITGWCNLSVKDSAGTSYASQSMNTQNGTDWQFCEKIFTVGDTESLILNFVSGNTSAGESLYVDCVTLNRIRKGGGVNLVGNGDFETGKVTGWTSSTSSIAAAADCPIAPTGNYAMKFVSTDYSYTNYTISATPNTDYALVFSVLNASPDERYSLNWHILDGNGTILITNNYKCPTTEWSTYAVAVNSGNSTSLTIRFQTDWKTGTYYIDDVMAYEAPPVSYDGYIYNGDFESGNANWTMHSASAAVEAAFEYGIGLNLYTDGGWGGMANQTTTATLVTGKEYTIRFRYKTVGDAGCNFTLRQDNSGGTKYATKWLYRATDWTLYTATFTAGSDTAYINFSGPGNTAYAGNIYIDDMMILPLEEMTNDGYIVNGNFDCGETTNWTISNSNTNVSIDAAKDGSYGLLLKGIGDWNAALAKQEFDTVEGRTYRVTFSYRAITNGVNVMVKNGSGNTLAQNYLTKRSWTQQTLIFRATENKSSLSFGDAGNGIATNFFVDNVSIELIPDTEVNLLEHGGKSAMEMNDTGNVGGLAFLFSANIKDFTYAEDDNDPVHKYTVYHYDEANPGKANPYTNEQFLNNPYDYTVVRMGAIVSNKVGEVLDSDLVIENTAEKSNIIDIVGSKAMKDMCDDTHYVYGVRVTNIPEAYFGRTIYARPYITILIGGDEVTLYGETVSACYDDYMGEVTE